ncbi:ATP-binding protein [Gammaproteobacteria bacterium]|nr:ATP-binding protein [Gammaproteobacteria bacterium]
MEAFRLSSLNIRKLVTLLIFMSVASLVALLFSDDDPNQLNRIQVSLLSVNLISFLILLPIVAISARRLFFDYKQKKLGAKLRLRMALAFSGLALIPAMVIFFFAINFMNKGISVWSDADVEKGLSNALMLGRSALDERIQDGLFKASNIAIQLKGMENVTDLLERKRKENDAIQLSLIDSDRRLLASSSSQVDQLSLRIPTNFEINQAMLKQSWTSLDSTADERYLIRALVPVISFSLNEKPIFLQALFSVDPKLSMMAYSVEETYARYGRLSFMKTPIQYSYALTLGIVVMLALLLAIYGSFEFADRLVKPIESLEKQTDNKNSPEKRFPPNNENEDEITALVNSFMAAQKEAAWSDVAKRMAHEINNPLTPIQLSAERIQKKFVGSLEEKEFIDSSTKTIISQVDVLRDLVGAFSNFAEREKLEFKKVDINHLIQESIRLYSQQYINTSFKLKKSDIGTIEIDTNKIQQVLNNLLLNAIDACQGAKEPRIELETKLIKVNSRDCCEIIFRDNGEGFDKNIIANAFEPYQTSKEQGKGLGLAIVKSIIDEHKGKIKIEKRDVGATIKIMLPILQN